MIYLVKNKEVLGKERSIVLADIAFYHPELDSGLLYAHQALKLARKINSPIARAIALEEISNKERKLGNIRNSFEASLKALGIYDSLGLREELAAAYSHLANNYMNDEDYVSAIKYVKESIHIYNRSDTHGNQIYAILNLGEMYRLAGHVDSAKTQFKKVLKRNEKLGDNIAQSYSQGNLGMLYNAQDSLMVAKGHLQEAIEILTELDDFYATSIYLAELGEVYQKENNYKAAKNKYEQALAMAQEAGLKEQIRDFSQKLTQFYEDRGDYIEALSYQKLFQVYQDSLVNKTNIQEIERLKAGYEIDKRESEIGLLNTLNTNQKYLLWVLGIGAFITLVFLYLLYKGNKKIQRANTDLSNQKEVISQREQEKALLLQELNHRVKNNLQMIASLLNLQSRELTGHPAKEALLAGKDRVEALSLVHRKLYQEGVDTRIRLKEYLEELILGLFHGYRAKFEPELKIIDISISIDTAIPLALIINELVVNALKYAYLDVDDPKLRVEVRVLDSNLMVEVIDNGRGFTQMKNPKNHSFGLKLIRSLVNQLAGTLKKLDSEGTHWQIELEHQLKLNIPTHKIPNKGKEEVKIFKRFRRRYRTKGPLTKNV